MKHVLSVPNAVDMRGKLKTNGTYKKVALSRKTTIAIHHSMTKTGSAESYARYHVDTHGWQGIGYHIVIEQDGTVKVCNDLAAVSYHVGDSNAWAIGICLTGDFRKGVSQPTDAQKESLRRVVAAIQKDVPSATRILGHNEFPGYSWKNCPGDGWNFRDALKETPVPAPEAASEAPKEAAPLFGTVKVIATSLNVRTEPRADAPLSRDPLPEGSQWKCYAEKDGWYCIGTNMWVHGNFVEFTDANGFTKLSGYVTVTADSLNVRTEPRADAPKAREALPKNSSWKTYGRNKDGWYCIGANMWVHGDFVEYHA